MADLVERVVVKGDGITLSRLLWRRFQRPVPGQLARTLDANPGLAALGPYIPPGTSVTIPLPGEGDAAPVLDPINLW